MSDIEYRPYRPEDRPALQSLFGAVYGPEAERRTSAWRYLFPGPYRALIQVAEADGRIVGAQPSHGVPLLVRGEPVQGLLLLDVMTHPDYRRRGVFTGVVEGLRRRAEADGYRVLLTTPNRHAERGFARLAHWKRMGELVPWVRVADPATLLAGGGAGRRLLSPLAAPWRAWRAPSDGGAPPAEPPVDADIDRLWRHTTGQATWELRRDATFIGWRFGPGSGRAYRRWGIMEKGDLTGLVITGSGVTLGRPVTFVTDLMVSSTARDLARVVLRSISDHAARNGDAAVIGWFAPGSASGALMRSAGFVPVPRMWRPRHYSIWGATDLSGDAGTAALDLTQWHMSLADSDLA